MILTKKDIEIALYDGKIVLHDGINLRLNPSTLKDQSIDVRLWRWLHIYENGKEYFHDLDESDFIITPERLMSTFIIAHTEEFIWTTGWSGILPTFKLKSSAGRLGIIHTLAGHWEVGYHNRWAMEFICAKPIILKRFMSIGQIYFTLVTSQDAGDDYSKIGTYQSSSNIIETVRNWTKESILPPKSLKVLAEI